MARKAREKSATGVYHVMLRGVNRQQIFHDEEDCRVFVEKMKEYKEKKGIKLFAYCIMSNHIHFLIKAEDDALYTFFRSFGAAYVYWYNEKYKRVGHLFQDRFKSEPVESERYFLTALRYILRNPVEAKMCAQPAEYKFSSMGEYLGGSGDVTDIKYAIDILGQNELIRFINTENEEKCMDDREVIHGRMSDAEARRIINEEFGDIKVLNRRERDYIVRKMSDRGISTGQICRFTEISKSTIYRIRRGI